MKKLYLVNSSKAIYYFVLFIYFFIYFLTFFAVAQIQPISLCTISKGFAGEYQYQFILTPNEIIDSSLGEGLVIATRPVPYDPTSPQAVAQVIINATYSVKGLWITQFSDSQGVVIVRDSFDKDSKFFITVYNSRNDESSPFTLYSYVSNKPSCYLQLTPERPFIAISPARITAETPATMYFFSSPPPSNSKRSAFIISVEGGAPFTVQYTRDDVLVKTKGAVLPILTLGSENVVVGLESVYLVFTPQFTSGTRIALIKISWRVLDEPTLSTQNISMQSGKAPIPTTVPSHYPIKKTSHFSFKYFLFFLCIVAFISAVIYNYRFNNETTFPDYIPFGNSIKNAFYLIKAKIAAIRSGNGAYSSVNGEDV